MAIRGGDGGDTAGTREEPDAAVLTLIPALSLSSFYLVGKWIEPAAAAAAWSRTLRRLESLRRLELRRPRPESHHRRPDSPLIRLDSPLSVAWSPLRCFPLPAAR